MGMTPAKPHLPHPRPWRITDTGSCFIVSDANGRGLAHVYYRREAALRDKYLDPDAARLMAQEIARLSLREDAPDEDG